jgi:hypothetical protein
MCLCAAGKPRSSSLTLSHINRPLLVRACHTTTLVFLCVVTSQLLEDKEGRYLNVGMYTRVNDASAQALIT